MDNEVSKDLRNKWVEALRSGKYTQTKGCLKNEKGFCYLGVACDVAGLTWIPHFSDGFPLEWSVNTLDEEGNSESSWLGLPSNLRNVLGLSHAQECTLSNMNDHDDSSFAKLADVIEKMSSENSDD